MSKIKLLEYVMSYIFVLGLGVKMAILSDKQELTLYDWVSLAINIWFVGFFIYQSHNSKN
jgi:hypothetical protein